MMCFINSNKGIAFENFHQSQNCILLSLRLSDPDERAIVIEEADLCVTSCLRILKSVTKSYSNVNFDLVLECLKSIEACLSFSQDRVMLDKDNERPVEKLKHIVGESLQVSIKWCKRYLNSRKFPCHVTDDTEKELQVCI